MFKRLFIFLFTAIVFFSFANKVKAQDKFDISASVTYQVETSGTTKVTHNISIKNLYSDLYATSYSLSLDNINPVNPSASEGQKSLPVSVSKTNDTTTLRVDFPDAVVGKDKERKFQISFEDTSFATRTGEVWEIAIPKLSNPDSFTNYQVTLLVPSSFGQKAYISPNATSENINGSYYSYLFSKESVAKYGISAGFGKFQVFSFNLNYHLENPLSKTATTQIAIPPDTAYQKVYYQNISPAPTSVDVDEDGNFMATYTLKPRERVDVKVEGSVQIFSVARDFMKPSQDTLNKNLQASDYWEVNDPQIQQLARTLKTPKAIYDYVTSTLSYDYNRVRPNVERLGAKAALQSPNTAICMEFTDLFVTLARAAGIPAREINGYAYTENPEIEPLSLVADVLHAWPEYWDSSREVWVPVDPTWGSTTGGVDFFNKLDLRHFAFVIHGDNSSKPYPAGSYKLGSNPQKDVFVNFGQLPQERDSKLQIVAETKASLPFIGSNLVVTVKNAGPVAVYNLSPKVYFDGQLMDTGYDEVLPAFSSYEMTVKIPFSFLGTKTPNKVQIVAGNEKIDVPTNKNQVIIYNLLALFILLSFIMLFVFMRVKKVKIKDLGRKMVGKLKRNEKSDHTHSGQKGPQESS